MNDNNSLLKELPETTHSFQIELTGSVTKKRFLGDFTCKIPTLRDQALIDKHNVMLNGENPLYVAPGIQKLHKMIAYLRFTLTEFPKFWRESDLGYDLRDFNVIESIYNEVIDFEDKWIKAIWGTEEEKDDGADSGEKEKEA